MKRDLQVAIVDYGMGNLFSVYQACEYVGLNPLITSNPQVIMDSNAIILPGVGAFGDAMNNLRNLDLINPIKKFIKSGKPMMGICLGMQLLLNESEEFGNHEGLKIIKGSVRKFAHENRKNEKVKIPHIGWSQIYRPSFRKKDFWDKLPMKNIRNGEFMYFVHSYYPVPTNEEIILSTSTYGGTEFCSSFLWKNVLGYQFHPEKSAIEGLNIYKNWASMI